MTADFLPTTLYEMQKLGWDKLDFLLISGDAYVDHPSFGTALIGRYLESLGYKVGIMPQPEWKDPTGLSQMGKPELAVLITSGNMDSMLNHYTARKNPRRQDAYSPGGRVNMRPDRATIVYANLARQVFKDVPLVLGGIEASLRRFVHYDYWEDSLRRSVLFDSKADLLIYGMAEYQIKKVADILQDTKYQGFTRAMHRLKEVPGICYIAQEQPDSGILIPSYEDCINDKKAFAESCRLAYLEQDPIRGKRVIQRHQNRFLVQNPPAPPLNEAELDAVYNLSFQRTVHPRLQELGVPALTEVKFSITSHRGCFGACSFCALHFHQGRIIQARSQVSIVREAEKMTRDPEFKGYIHDVGGPSANFRRPSCQKQLASGTCKERQCLFPKPCPRLEVSHADYLQLLRRLRKVAGVKKVYVRSGLRYDYLLLDKDKSFLTELCQHHISGQLKVAPEHAAPAVNRLMGKSSIHDYVKFKDQYEKMNARLGKRQYLIPYFMSGHPGTTLMDAVLLAEFMRDENFLPDQAQEFIPTPGSLSTCMYYTGLDPLTGKAVHVPKGEEKAMQRALLQYKKMENRPLVRRALKITGRTDLIGKGKKCLIPL